MKQRSKRIMQRNITMWAGLLLAFLASMALTGCASTHAGKYAEVDGHRFVDLQLPSGLLWAETNIGAENETDFGNQYAWGETQVKADYSQATYRNGTDDAASVLWGKDCRMPTYKDLQELGDTANCTWTWTAKTTAKGDTIKGYEVKSVRNGNTIFLPASGAHNGKNYYKADEDAIYWTSTLAPRSDGEAYCLYFNLGHYSYYMNDRSIGGSVRPVAKPKR